MDKARTALTLFLLITFSYGCSGIKVSQDYDANTNLSGLKTYRWQTLKQQKTGDVRIDNPLLDSRIRTAVDNTLQIKNIQKSSTNPPDFYIGYQYSIRSKIKSSAPKSSVGVGFGSYGRRGAIGVSSGTDITEYDEGLLVIDMTEPQNGNLLWRGSATSPINQHASPEKVTRKIATIVEKVLNQFPPGQ